MHHELHGDTHVSPHQRSAEAKPAVKINSGGPALLLSGLFLLVRCGFKIYDPDPEARKNIARCLALGICIVLAGAGVIVQQMNCPAGFYSSRTPRQQAEAARFVRSANRM